MVDIIFMTNTENMLREWIDYRKEKGIESEYVFVTKSKGEYDGLEGGE